MAMQCARTLDFLTPSGVVTRNSRRASARRLLSAAPTPFRGFLLRVMKSSPANASAPDRGAWILVVDDDKTMLGLVELLLRGQGWQVEAVGGADAALAAIDRAPTPPRVLVCDVIMDGVDGLQLTRTLRARVPGLRAIVVSAHLNDVAYWPEDLNDCRFLSKPFAHEELIGAVSTALSG